MSKPSPNREAIPERIKVVLPFFDGGFYGS
jgi:hypothetical protein